MAKVDKAIREVTADGKEEIVPGREPLKKDPKKKLKDRWKDLKKALDHEKAILDLHDEQEPDEDEQEMQEQQSPEGEPVAAEIPGDDSEVENSTGPDMDTDQPDQEDGDEEADEEAPMDDQSGVGEGDGPQLPDESEGAQEGDEQDGADPEELKAALEEAGYSPQEIAYIVHGHHAPEIDETKQAKADATKAMSEVEVENAKRKFDMEHQLAQQK